MMKIHVEHGASRSHGAARSIQAWPRPLGSRSRDTDEVAAAQVHPLADRVRLALTPYGASSVVIGAPHLQQAQRRDYFFVIIGKE